MKHLRTIGGVLLALVASAALTAGCGRGSDHNDQDVSFARDMVPHHQQAITMANLARTQTTNQQIHDLASRITTSQQAELGSLNGWLETWKVKATDHGGHDMGGTKGMHGMVSDADLRTMEAANGAEFDRLFLLRMTAHHKGAIGMAKVQLDKGRFGPAKELARRITTTQEKEIAEMAQLLSAPPAAP